MDASHIQQTLLDRHGLRVEPEMSRYIARQLNRSDRAGQIVIIAGDARTGMPLRHQLPLSTLQTSEPPRQSQGELFS